MRVTEVAKSGPMPFSGDRIGVGSDAMLEPGDVIVHVDQSSKCRLFTVIPAADGIEGRLPDMATAANPEGLAAATRDLLFASPAERIARGAKNFLEEVFLDPDTTEEDRLSRKHYESLAMNVGFVSESRENDLSAVDTATLLAELRRRGAV